MNRRSGIFVVRAVMMFLLLTVTLAAIVANAEEVAATGSWQLVKRKLPDGTIQTSPLVGGMSTTTGMGVNHLNVFWRTPDGKPASVSSITQFKWSETELSATRLFSAFDDGSGKGGAYGAPGETRRVPVKREGGRISYQHPFDPPSVVFDGDKMTATADGLFVDYWERVK
jgi:hypothetical protein